MVKKQILKKIIISSALLFSIFLMCLMSNKETNEIKQELVYIDNEIKKENIYLLDRNNFLARTSVLIDNEDIELKAKELLNILIKDSSEENKIPSGFKGVIPSNTEILSLEYKNNLIKVNFNNYLLDVKEDEEEKVIEAIIYTLTSIEEVKKVIIYVDGNILTKLPKSKINLPSTLDRSYGINKEYNLKDYKDVTKVTIYYLNNYNDEIYYVPVTKYLNDNRNKMEIVIDELSNSNNNLMSYLNSNTLLLDTKIKDNTLFLTFNEYIFNNQDERKILDEVKNSISLSAKDNLDIDKVVFNYNEKEICKTVIKSIE
ncbi:MAG: GerMN domain-containing protein [Bacilli bacterium]|nr:GerMN domain-containing protein [Bacilli bacterium]